MGLCSNFLGASSIYKEFNDQWSAFVAKLVWILTFGTNQGSQSLRVKYSHSDTRLNTLFLTIGALMIAFFVLEFFFFFSQKTEVPSCLMPHQPNKCMVTEE